MLRNIRFTLAQTVVEEVEENNVSMGQLKKNKKTTSEVRGIILQTNVMVCKGSCSRDFP